MSQLSGPSVSDVAPATNTIGVTRGPLSAKFLDAMLKFLLGAEGENSTTLCFTRFFTYFANMLTK